ncbi:CBS domain-containing protein [Actinobacteria bacterium YIM 96077]|uniref:Histidine kinase n=1 Tax=Phytoactinopolyspora halophila TaxID=1981511 RepID=A0A329R4H9_9ACTN|nr:CBS domain-containing protein [Phytoactinopolyspora halophila]AYY11508.1 CBS domain-containing protein [Actinobacteria bacterium YIM 96077]RAW18008.1 histidine kinase [Phytoactinopolyspora halophila]
MHVSDLLGIKGNSVVSVSPEDDVRTLLAVLADHHIGAVVVSAGDGLVDGIVSERDIVRALASYDVSILSEPVSAIMTSEVQTCTPDTDLEELSRVMTTGRFRHVPVLADGRLVGIVSIGDVVKSRITELEVERDSLSSYITKAAT